MLGIRRKNICYNGYSGILRHLQRAGAFLFRTLGGETVAKKDELGDGKNQNDAVEDLRTALAKLALKTIDDINNKRVHKPEEMYNALVSIYNAIK